jgi:hypothetical protein
VYFCFVDSLPGHTLILRRVELETKEHRSPTWTRAGKLHVNKVVVEKMVIELVMVAALQASAGGAIDISERSNQ